MRKRSKYRPKPILLDGIHYAKMGVMKVKDAPHQHLDRTIAITAELAAQALQGGRADRVDIEYLVSILNIVEALMRVNHNLGKPMRYEIMQAQEAIYKVAGRGAIRDDGQHYCATCEEMAAIWLGLDIHKHQMDKAIIADITKALDWLRVNQNSGKHIKEN